MIPCFCEAGILEFTVTKREYHVKINVGREIQVTVSNMVPDLKSCIVPNTDTHPISKYLWLFRNEIQIFFLSVILLKWLLSC